MLKPLLTQRVELSMSDIKRTCERSMSRSSSSSRSSFESDSPLQSSVRPAQVASTATPASAEKQDANPPATKPPLVDPQPRMTTRILSADEFRSILQSSVTPHPPGEWAGAPNATRASRPRPATTNKTRLSKSVSARWSGGTDFIDPYAGTNFKFMISAPGTENHVGKAPRKNKSNSSVLHKVSEASRVQPVTMNATCGRDSRVPDAIHELEAAKAELRRKDALVKQLQGIVRRATVEPAPAAIASNNSQFAQLCSCRCQVVQLEAEVAMKGAELDSARSNAKTLRAEATQKQADAYLSEVRRLQRLVADLERCKQSGLEGAALREANSTSVVKDAQILALQQRTRSLRDTLCESEQELQRWKDLHKAATERLAAAEAKLDAASDAPQVVAHLQQQIQQLNQQLHAVEARPKSNCESPPARSKHRVRESQPPNQPSLTDPQLRQLESERDHFKALHERNEASRVAQDAQMKARLAEAEIAFRRESDAKLKETGQLFADREAALKGEIADLRRQLQVQDDLVTRLRADHLEELEAQKQRDQQRQEGMLRTLGSYERQRHAEQERLLQEQEARLGQMRLAFEHDKASAETVLAQHRADLAAREQAVKRAALAPQPPPTQRRDVTCQTAPEARRDEVTADGASGSPSSVPASSSSPKAAAPQRAPTVAPPTLPPSDPPLPQPSSLATGKGTVESTTTTRTPSSTSANAPPANAPATSVASANIAVTRASQPTGSVVIPPPVPVEIMAQGAVDVGDRRPLTVVSTPATVAPALVQTIAVQPTAPIEASPGNAPREITVDTSVAPRAKSSPTPIPLAAAAPVPAVSPATPSPSGTRPVALAKPTRAAAISKPDDADRFSISGTSDASSESDESSSESDTASSFHVKGAATAAAPPPRVEEEVPTFTE